MCVSGPPVNAGGPHTHTGSEYGATVHNLRGNQMVGFRGASSLIKIDKDTGRPPVNHALKPSTPYHGGRMAGGPVVGRYPDGTPLPVKIVYRNSDKPTRVIMPPARRATRESICALALHFKRA